MGLHNIMDGLDSLPEAVAFLLPCRGRYFLYDPWFVIVTAGASGGYLSCPGKKDTKEPAKERR